MGFILGIVALIVCWRLYSKLTELENRLNQLDTSAHKNTVAQVTAEPGSFAEKVAAEPPRPASPLPPPPATDPYGATEAKTGDQFIEWIKEDFLVKLGAGLLLLAFGWFVSYAFANNWIGPAGRISLGLLLSALLMILGVVRISNRPHQGGIFLSLGATGVLLTLFAARELYDMFTPTIALAVSFFTALFVAFVSVQHNRKSLAYAGLLLGSIAPLLVDVNTPDPLLFFLYLLLVAAGTLWVVWLTGWTSLILTSLIITFSYSALYLLDTVGDNGVAIMFSFVFVSLYYAANMVSLVRRHGQGVHHVRIHAYTAFGTALFLFAWIQAGIPAEWQSLVYIAWSLIFALGTYVVYNFTANLPAFYLYGGTSAALIGFATAAELDGGILVIAYLFEALVVVLAAAAITKRVSLVTKLSWLFAVPFLLSVNYFNYLRWDTVIGIESVVLILAALSYAVVAIVLHGLAKQQNTVSEGEQYTSTWFGLLAAGQAAFLVWSCLQVALAPTLATTIALTIYTIVGIAALLYGRTIQNDIVRGSGAVLIGFVVLRLLVIDVWQMSIEGRIIAFLIIGVLLISTAFMSKQINGK